jgi:hypothetical protein
MERIQQIIFLLGPYFTFTFYLSSVNIDMYQQWAGMRISFVFWVSGHSLFANQLFLIMPFMLKSVLTEVVWNLILSSLVGNYEVKSKYIWIALMSSTHRDRNSFTGTIFVLNLLAEITIIPQGFQIFFPIMICCPPVTFSRHKEYRLTVGPATCPLIMTPLRTSDVTYYKMYSMRITRALLEVTIISEVSFD